MSQYYNANRTKNLYNPTSKEPFKLSRTKIDLFLECPRCFYFDRKLGVGRPPGFPFTLNSAVDALLKQEFDTHRAKGEAHPLMKKYGIDAVPISHEKLNEWRENFKGVQYHHKPTNLIITGAIDDLWQNSKGEFIVVEYKATSKNEAITGLNEDWHKGYKKQMEIYQWLLRQNGYKVSNIGYFVYCNGKKDKKAFDAKLEFDITVIDHNGDDGWVEQAVIDAHKCLNSRFLPEPSAECDYCAYRQSAQEQETHHQDVNRYKIILVEDDEILSRLYSAILTKKGFNVIALFDIEDDFIEAVVEAKPDLISLDTILPTSNGFKGAELLKADERTKNIPIFFLTNMEDAEYVKEGKELGAVDYLIKAENAPQEVAERYLKYLKIRDNNHQ